jgi:FkbM family methyltransferase
MKKVFKTITFYSQLIVSYLLFLPYTNNRYQCRKYGNDGAAWWVPIDILKPGAIVYSGGVGQDITFELALIKQHQVEVFAFDPTPKAITFIKKYANNKRLHFYPWGLWEENKKLRFFSPSNENDVSHSIVNLQKTTTFFWAECKTIQTILKKLSHTRIDILKIDIEGAEYAVLNNLLQTNILPKVICVEFDQPTTLVKMWQMVHKLRTRDYVLIKQDYFNFTFIQP